MTRVKVKGIANFIRTTEGKEVIETRGPKWDLPRDFSLRAAREVLDGDFCSLMQAFTWASTPQGSLHWDEIYEGDRDLTSEDYGYIEYCVEEFCRRRGIEP